jgi:hypothetical protein
LDASSNPRPARLAPTIAGLALAASLGACGANAGTGALGTAAGAGAGGAGTGAGGARPTGAGGAPQPVGPPLATGIAITSVDLQQAVSIPLMKDGQLVASPNAPVVQNREALLRVLVAPAAGFSPRDVVAELDLEDASGPLPPMNATLHVTAASSEGALGSTFNFELPAARMTGDLRWSVSLREAPGAAPGGGDASGAEVPAGGAKAPFGARDSHGDFKVMIVPFAYGADGTNRLPDTSAGQMATYHRRLLGTYPAPDAEVTLHAPVPFSTPFTPDGAGFSDLLDATCQLRQSDAPAPNVYYYGIIEPADSLAQFCAGGCVAGLANLTQDPNDDYGRCAIGLGYPGQDTVDVALQEIAHALGRMHADCGNPDLVDPFYPYPKGTIGHWGWDQTTGQLEPPSLADFMSYCKPVWVSDYTYAALFERLSFVNSTPSLLRPGGAPADWQTVLVSRDRTTRLGSRVHVRGATGGEPRTVQILDAHGRVVGSATGRFYAWDRLGGGTLLVPAGAIPEGGSVALGSASTTSPSAGAGRP